jgi:hypothetical protein
MTGVNHPRMFSGVYEHGDLGELGEPDDRKCEKRVTG